MGEEGDVSPSPGSVTSMTTARMDPTRRPAVSSLFFRTVLSKCYTPVFDNCLRTNL